MAASPYQAYRSGYSCSGFCRPDKHSAIRWAVPDGGFALSGLRGSAPGFVGRISAAPSGEQCLMAASPYQAYRSGYSWSGFCRPDKRSAIRRAVPDGGFALSGLRGSAPGFVGRISAAPSGGRCLMGASPYQAYGSGYSGSGFCRPDKRSAIRQLNQRFTFSCSVSCGKTEW